MILFAATQIQAQETDQVQKADKYYELYAFDQAIKLYEEALATAPGNYEAMSRLAECYRQTNRLDKAGLWYSKAAENPNVDPVDIFYYAQVLKSLGRYEEAKTRFEEYAAHEPALGNHYAKSCDYAKANTGGESDFSIRAVNNINTPASDFAPNFYKDQLVFSSFKKTGTEEGEAFNQLFISNIADLQVGASKLLRSSFNAAVNEGYSAFSADGSKIAYVKNNNNFTDGVAPLMGSGVKFDIYLGNALTQENWEEVMPFPYNGRKYSNAYPFLTPDGNTLYFASDVPGGYGGFDIYVSQREGSDWSEPVNLGGSINTGGDEISPFILGTTMFFASNWHNGYGGLDIFKSTQTNAMWSAPKNMGKDINSSYNDYDFIYNPGKKLGFFVSNRAVGGKGKDDIYQAVPTGYVASPPITTTTTEPVETTTTTTPESPTTTPPTPATTNTPTPQHDNTSTPQHTNTPTTTTIAKPDNMVLTIVDEISRQPITDVKVDFARCNGPIYKTDGQGQAELNKFNEDCMIMISRAGYGEQLFKFPMVAQMEISLTKREGAFTGRVMNSETEDPLAGVLIIATNKSTQSEIKAVTDERGRYALQLEPTADYDVIYSKASYLNTARSIRVSDTNPDLGIQEMELSPFFDPAAVVVAPEPTRPGVTTAGLAAPVTNIGGVTTTMKPVEEEEKPVVVAPPPPPPISEPSRPTAVTTTMYEVQVGAFSSPRPEKFRALADIGLVYPDKRGELTIYKVGVFKTREEAETARAQIVGRGYGGAFVRTVTEKNPVYDAIETISDNKPTPSTINTVPPRATPPVVSPPTIVYESVPAPTVSPSGSVVFRVQLAAYRNPEKAGGFDYRLNDFGTIQQIQRADGLTVFLLGDYYSLSEASVAKQRARELGVSAAFVVAYRNGVKVGLSEVAGN